jgi:hypothetical protein
MALLSDITHLLINFHDLLALSAMHTYVTALPLSPKDSTLYERYGLELKFATWATEYHATAWNKRSATQ